MVDQLSSPVAAAPATSPKAAKKVVKAQVPKAKPNHPSTADMVYDAIKTLHERNGSSLQAIKKYMTGTYNVDTHKLAPFIKKYLKAAVESETLIQTKGKGASGSFKIPPKATGAVKVKSKAPPKDEVPPKKAVKKPGAKKTEAESKSKKVTSPKKSAKKPAGEKKVERPKAEKTKISSPSKVKKVTKGPTAPKAPKPKKSPSPKIKPAAKKVTVQKK